MTGDGRCPTCGGFLGDYGECVTVGCPGVDAAPEPDPEPGQMSEASEEDFDRWARRYDDLNGAPESDEDR